MGVRAACMKNGKDNFVLFLNGNTEDPDTVGSFLHEMLHILHQDYENTSCPVGQIEAARQQEIIDVLDALRTRDS